MKDVYQTSMTDLYSSTSFGGGGSAGSSAGGGRATLGPGGGSDPGNHQAARTGNGLGTGPLTPSQEMVGDIVVGAAIGGWVGGTRAAFGGAASSFMQGIGSS